jgi:hypothetical protein
MQVILVPLDMTLLDWFIRANALEGLLSPCSQWVRTRKIRIQQVSYTYKLQVLYVGRHSPDQFTF